MVMFLINCFWIKVNMIISGIVVIIVLVIMILYGIVFLMELLSRESFVINV